MEKSPPNDHPNAPKDAGPGKPEAPKGNDKKKSKGKKAAKIAGAAAAVVLVAGAVGYAVVKSKTISVKPGSGPEGTEVTVASPKPLPASFGPVSVKFYDPGVHGWHFVYDKSVPTHVAYDPAKGLSYTAPATAVPGDKKRSSFTAIVPPGICGIIIESSQAKTPPPKVLQVSLVGADGKPVAGLRPGKFKLKCDKYTLKVKIKAVPDKLDADGVSASTVTANLSVKGPAQVVIGQDIKKPSQPITLVSPLGFVMVHFTTDLGVLAPNPANVKTDAAGDATVTVTSADAGIASVRAVAEGIGDAKAKVHFMPKITAVKQDFVEPDSPTNYQLKTIPANPKDLTFAWEIIYPGPPCGSLTKGAGGLGASQNGYFHGPTDGFPKGCDPDKYEKFVQIKVTATDKDGDSDSKTFPARAYEGQGFVNLP